MAQSFYVDFLNKYQYFRSPDGTDPVHKIMGLTKIGWLASGYLTLIDTCLITRTRNAAQFFNTAGFYFVPITGMCLTFSTVTYAMTNLRKKDDHWNYVAGALASGFVFQQWAKKIEVTGPATFLFVIYAVMKKEAFMNPDRYGHGLKLFVPQEVPTRWMLPWRNVPYRDYTGELRWEPEKDYYTHFDYKIPADNSS
ncbi:hypothetical protein QAD02_017333 [Eretmocerus hayati]|uniref:Uncharacterized protein n=1 Tax=Eretmocerus hayati TaxID=131215 RepID=A0ACC2PEW1_9HYME|nr:hypothetical protein QAD02_017333 [Eretmocerus hayati]